MRRGASREAGKSLFGEGRAPWQASSSGACCCGRTAFVSAPETWLCLCGCLSGLAGRTLSSRPACPSLFLRYNLNDETGELEAAEDWEPQPGPEMAQPGSWTHRYDGASPSTCARADSWWQAEAV